MAIQSPPLQAFGLVGNGIGRRITIALQSLVVRCLCELIPERCIFRHVQPIDLLPSEHGQPPLPGKTGLMRVPFVGNRLREKGPVANVAHGQKEIATMLRGRMDGILGSGCTGNGSIDNQGS